jgi:hypothetical protein
MEDTEQDEGAEPAVPPAAEGDADEVGWSPSPIEDRFERLTRILLWVGDPEIVRGLRTITAAEMDQQAVPIRTALQALKRKHDPASFLLQPQYRPTVPLIAEAAAEDCQHAVVSALGDAADNPDRRQLDQALEEVRDHFPVSTVALMLAYVSVTDMMAADLCDEILESEEAFSVPERP